MSLPAEVDPRRPLYRAIPILDLDDPAPLDVVEAAPLEVEAVAALNVTEPAPLLVTEQAAPPDAPIALPANQQDADSVSALAVQRSPIGHVAWAVRSAVGWLFGFAALLVGLAVLAAIPGLNFLSLGYLLESSARVARSGRLRDGFLGVRLAGRLGGIVFGSWLCLLPAMFVADLARSAAIIDPGGRAAEGWRFGLLVLIGLTFVHIAAACARGGKLRYFAWPFNVIWLARRVFRGGYYAHARDAVWDTYTSLRLPYYFWLGFRGFVGAFAWLALPITLLVVSRYGHTGGSSFLGFIGAVLLVLILPYLPFLQLRLATTNRLRDAFEVMSVRRDYSRAPWAFTFAFVVTLLFALPLYLLKIQIVPREAAWLPSLVFIVFIFPARLLTGWAMGRANRLTALRPEPRHWFFRWTGRIPILPASVFYVLIAFFTQFTSWHGVWSLYEQHAFLVPVPFFGL